MTCFEKSSMDISHLFRQNTPYSSLCQQHILYFLYLFKYNTVYI